MSKKKPRELIVYGYDYDTTDNPEIFKKTLIEDKWFSFDSVIFVDDHKVLVDEVGEWFTQYSAAKKELNDKIEARLNALQADLKQLKSQRLDNCTEYGS